ncbi:MAG: M67 family metallopeptidase [Tildeniella nuda ZEHNDER 1965/U140]|nr:M67 family metallopeptidase [Tildeniella nuda ZEHNDER 1965/U140]
MSLTLPADRLQAIHAHAERTYPEECCGLLLGTIAADKRVVHDVYEVLNAWDTDAAHQLNDNAAFTKTRRYWIAPEDMLAGMREARRRNLEIIGIYHSHPDYPAVPSECDRAIAWSQYSYLIVSVEQGIAKDVRSWTLNEQHLFESEAIQIAETARM